MTDEPLSLVLNFSEGVGEIIADINHPIVAPFRRAMEEGQLPGSWRYLIINDTQNKQYCVIGAFVKTPNGRLLFFPGSNIFIEADDPSAHFNDKQLDHLTADPPKGPKLSSHIAVRGLPHNKSRGLPYRSKTPDGYVWPWFSLLVPDQNVFPQLPKRLVIRFLKPPGDLSDFGKRLLSDGDYKIVPLPEIKELGSSYLQLDVWICHEPFNDTGIVRPLAWPYKKSIVEGAPSGNQVLTVHRVDISISPEIIIVVLITRPLGNLPNARILRPTISK